MISGMNLKFKSLYFVSDVLLLTDLKRSSHDRMYNHRPVKRISICTKNSTLGNFVSGIRNFELFKEGTSGLMWNDHKLLALHVTLRKEDDFGWA